MKSQVTLLLAVALISRQLAAATVPVEREVHAARGELLHFEKTLTLAQKRELGSVDRQRRMALLPSLRRLHDRRQVLREEVRFWESVEGLKKELLALTPPLSATADEADWIAREAGRSIRELRKKYRMVRPAGLHNVLINIGLKEEGFCWHWTRDLLARLDQRRLNFFELRWGISREGSLREHNSVVITPRGVSFDEGLVVDPWRFAGRLYWIPVKSDRRYPWQEFSDARSQ